MTTRNIAINKISPKHLLGFALVALFQVLFIIAATVTHSKNLPALLVFLVINLALVIGYLLASKKLTNINTHLLADFDLILANFIGGMTAYFINNHLKLGSVFGASLVGLLVHFFMPVIRSKNKNLLPAAVYCGSFVGMSLTLVLPNLFWTAIASLFVGLIFVISKASFAGYGGKLGTMAFIAVSLAVLLIKLLG